MTNFSIIDRIEYENKSYPLQLAEEGLSLLRISLNGSQVDFDGENFHVEEKTHHVGLRVLAALGALFLFPVTLMALAVKFWKQEEWQNISSSEDFYYSTSSSSETEEETEFLKEQEELQEALEEELLKAQHLDKKLAAPLIGSWRKYKEGKEFNQSFSDYLESVSDLQWPDRRPLHIQLIGSFNKVDLKIMKIACDYLKVFHNISVKVSKTILTMKELGDKYLDIPKSQLKNNYSNTEEYLRKGFPNKKGQYEGDLILHLMDEVLVPDLKDDFSDKPLLIAFTNEDLFPLGGNYLFGIASEKDGVGIWSKARYGDPSSSPKAFEKCLLRMMKVCAHEFGHMRKISHCTDYECNIGGYLNREELDRSPLLYCLQDTAKICYLTSTTLLENQKKVLNFFEKFNDRYGLTCDFSKEIGILKNRISAISSHPV